MLGRFNVCVFIVSLSSSMTEVHQIAGEEMQIHRQIHSYI